MILLFPIKNLIFMKQIYLFILFVLALMSCTNQSNTSYEVQDVEFNLETDGSVNYQRLSEIVNEVTFIPLKHSTDESLIGYIDKIIVTETYIAIMDESNKILNLYDLEGNYIRRIGKIGQGPGEYIGLGDFQIYNDTIVVFDAPRRMILAYNMYGDFIFQKELPFQTDIFAVLNEDLWLWGLSSYNTEQYANSQIVLTDKNFNLLEKYVTYNKDIDHNMKLSYYFVNSNNEFVYHQGLENEVYVFSQDGTLSECFKFDFGTYNIKREYLKDMNKLWESRDSYCYLATTPLVTNKYILGVLNISGELSSFIYDKSTKAFAINSLSNYNPLMLNLPIYINNNMVFSYFNAEIFPKFRDVALLDNQTKEAISDGEYVIVKYQLR